MSRSNRRSPARLRDRTLARPLRFDLVIYLAIASAMSCTVDRDADRAAWLHATLVADRYGDLQRNPVCVAEQLDLMEENLYAYMRGTLPQFRRDVAEPFSGESRSKFLSKASSLVQLVGDPHIENIGSFPLPSGELAIEFKDFDGAIYGSYHLDVWRLALSWYAFGASASFTRTRAEDWLNAAEAVALGYAEDMVKLASGQELADLTDSPVFRDLLEEAKDDGENRAVLEDYTEVGEDGVRRFRSESDVLAALAPAELEWISKSLPQWRASLVGDNAELGAFTSAARRLGAGVASVFLIRYYLLFEGPSAQTEDDVLVEWKETRDPCFIATGLVDGTRLFTSNGERVTVMQRRAHGQVDSDRSAGWVGQGPWSFRSRRNSGYQSGIESERIIKRLRDGRFDAVDLQDAGYAMGQLLARTHAHARPLVGNSAAEAIAPLVMGKVSEFAAETREQVAVMGPRLVDDFRLFALLRVRFGRSLEQAR